MLNTHIHWLQWNGLNAVVVFQNQTTIVLYFTIWPLYLDLRKRTTLAEWRRKLHKSNQSNIIGITTENCGFILFIDWTTATQIISNKIEFMAIWRFISEKLSTKRNWSCQNRKTISQIIDEMTPFMRYRFNSIHFESLNAKEYVFCLINEYMWILSSQKCSSFVRTRLLW